MADLFDEISPLRNKSDKHIPLAERMRPDSIAEVFGQAHLTAKGAPLARMLDQGMLQSFILAGPPGSGKTTLARLIASAAGAHYEQISAIFSGIAELRKLFDQARLRLSKGKQTILFVDEIHRFNKAQQDSFLPVVEDGTVILIGATTENPSFALNAALLSRMQVFVLNPLSESDLDNVLARAEATLNIPLFADSDARNYLISLCSGDARYLLNMTEQVAKSGGHATRDAIASLSRRRAALYDRAGDQHYNLISALHKSIRGSDPDAALYWLCRMLEAGEDPGYLARRLLRIAWEDIGLADRDAPTRALTAWQTYERLGSPEGELALAQLVIDFALTPKSNSAYIAYKAAQDKAKTTNAMSPPKHILNAPTAWMKSEGYGKSYIYDHDTENRFSGQNYFPDTMPRPSFYVPTTEGEEADLRVRLERFASLRANKTHST